MSDEALTEQLKTVLDREAATIARYDAKVEKLETLMQFGFAEYERRLGKAVEALKKALYFLNPTDSDMEKRAGIYRIVTTLAEIEGEKG